MRSAVALQFVVEIPQSNVLRVQPPAGPVRPIGKDVGVRFGNQLAVSIQDFENHASGTFGLVRARMRQSAPTFVKLVNSRVNAWLYLLVEDFPHIFGCYSFFGGNHVPEFDRSG